MVGVFVLVWVFDQSLELTPCGCFPLPQVNTVVSGALDRLHYEKDPCVKYDIGRKLWIYLHRDRSQEEFGERLNAPRVKRHFKLEISLKCFFFFLPRADSSGPSCRCKSQESVAAETQAGVETRESTADIIS